MKKGLILFLFFMVFGGSFAYANGPACINEGSNWLINFEGIPSFTPVGASYAGCGVTFSPNGAALTSGNYGNNPSPPGILFFPSGPSTVMNVPAGFINGLSFYYAAGISGQVKVYSEENATGVLLATVPLPVTPSPYYVWQQIIVNFSGIAKSADFSGSAGFIGFDDIRIPSILDTDGDGLPDWWEILYGTDPNNPNDPVITDDVDGDGLNWLQEYQNGTNPLNPDTDGDGVNDGNEVAIGTNPVVSDAPVSIVEVVLGEIYGTVYFKFTVNGGGGPAPRLHNVPSFVSGPVQTTGYRVYYGGQSCGPVPSCYDAHFDINDVNARDGLIDQRWGMQGVPVVYFRIAPIGEKNGNIFVGELSNEGSAYFAGTKFTEESSSSVESSSPSTSIKTGCFIATAAYGSYEAPHVKILRDFRDAYLTTNIPGRFFVDLYYKISPPAADFISGHEWLKAFVRVALLPAIGFSYLMVEASVLTKVMAFSIITSLIAFAGYRAVLRRRV